MGKKEISAPAMIGIIAAFVIVVGLIGWKMMKPPLADPGKPGVVQAPPPQYQQYQQQVRSGNLPQNGGSAENSNDMNARRRAMMGGMGR